MPMFKFDLELAKTQQTESTSCYTLVERGGRSNTTYHHRRFQYSFENGKMWIDSLFSLCSLFVFSVLSLFFSVLLKNANIRGCHNTPNDVRLLRSSLRSRPSEGRLLEFAETSRRELSSLAVICCWEGTSVHGLSSCLDCVLFFLFSVLFSVLFFIVVGRRRHARI